MRTASVFLTLLFALASARDVEAKRRAVHHPKPVTNPLYTEGGYGNRISVPQGGTLDLHLATAVTPFTLQVVNLARPNEVLRSVTLSGTPRDCTGLSDRGCRWPVSTVLSIPVSWPSGYYAARFPTSQGTRHVFFVVREDAPGSTSRMAVVASTHTYQAYNTYGGLSTYPSNAPERGHHVSYDRPFHDNRGLGRFPRWDEPFLQWLTRENRPFEVLTDTDLEQSTILNQYDLLVLVGHPEYFTSTARTNVETFVGSGGRLAVLGGNTMWWQVRFDATFRRMTVYKDARLDPETGRNNAVVTTNFFAEPVLRPENLLLGASFRNGGYTNRHTNVHGYTVANAGHWLFAGTGVTNGQQFGHMAAGLEVDGALYNCTMNGLEPDGSDGTPLNFQIVAAVPAAEGHGTIGVHTNPAGGAVFNAATQDWSIALATDPVVQRMTRNVLDRFLQGRQPHTPAPNVNGMRTRELFNCVLEPTEGTHVPGWRGDERDLTFSTRCAQEGPRGLELSGDPRIRVVRNFAPTGNATDRADTSFSLNADALSGPSSAIVNLVTLQSRRNNVPQRAARMELDPAGKRVRLTLFNPSSAAYAQTAWIALASGWNAIELSWRSPGAVSLRVGTGTPQTVQNVFSGQSVSELQITYEQASVSGHLCMDTLEVAVR